MRVPDRPPHISSLAYRVPGLCSVKRNDSSHHQLSMWVNRIRKKYRHGLLLDHQIEALEDIGFEWSVISPTLPFENGVAFLECYKQQHGHCCVPVTYPPNQRLATWVHNQRAQFVRKLRNMHSYLSHERIEKLTQVGLFDFSSKECYRSILQVARSEEEKVISPSSPILAVASTSPDNKPVSYRPITSFLIKPKKNSDNCDSNTNRGNPASPLFKEKHPSPVLKKNDITPFLKKKPLRAHVIDLTSELLGSNASTPCSNKMDVMQPKKKSPIIPTIATSVAVGCMQTINELNYFDKSTIHLGKHSLLWYRTHPITMFSQFIAKLTNTVFPRFRPLPRREGERPPTTPLGS